jgi:two-component system sensor histidine kinase BaeS
MVKRYLIVKLLAVNLVVVGFAVAVVWLAIDTLAAGYFVTLMEKYHISPGPAHAMFVDSVHRYLVWALAGAMGLAVLLSFVMNRRILGPLTRMNAVTRRNCRRTFFDSGARGHGRRGGPTGQGLQPHGGEPGED